MRAVAAPAVVFVAVGGPFLHVIGLFYPQMYVKIRYKYVFHREKVRNPRSGHPSAGAVRHVETPFMASHPLGAIPPPRHSSPAWAMRDVGDAMNRVSTQRASSPAPAFFPRVGHAGRGRRDKSRLYAADTPAAAGVVTRWWWHFFNTENAIFSSARSFARKYAKIRKT